MKSFKAISLLLIFTALLISSCQERVESPVKGSLKCYVDESLFNLIKAERDSFVQTYPESKIELVSVKAREGIASILNGESKLFVSSRDLNEEEKKYSEQRKSEVRGFKFCFDAVVPIVGPRDSKEKITLDDIKKILSGQTQGYTVIIPERNSGVFEYIKMKLLDKKDPVANSYAKSEAEVISKIRDSKKCIGFVGLNVVTDSSKVRILEVASRLVEGAEDHYYKPYVAYLVTESYPLVRTNTVFLNEFGVGLASGFATYLTSFEGQKVASKNNLGPATVKVKMVEQK